MPITGPDPTRARRLLHASAFTCLLPSCTGDDGTSTETSATGSETTSSGNANCERRESTDSSPVGYAWSFGCAQSNVAPEIARSAELGPLVQFWTVVGPGALSLEGEDFVLDGPGDAVIARFDTAGHSRWNQVLRTHQSAAVGVFGGLPDDSAIICAPSSGALDVGGSTVVAPLDRLTAKIVALDPDGLFRWSIVLSGEHKDSSVLPNMMATSRGGLAAVLLSASEPVFVDSLGPFEISTAGGFMITVDSSGAIRKAGPAPSGFLRALADDGSLLLEDSNNGVLARTDASWNPAWSRTVIGEWVGRTWALFGANGDVVIAGHFGGSINLGGETLLNNEQYVPEYGNQDVFLARYASDGAHLWSMSRGGSNGVVGLGGDGATTIVLVSDESQVTIEQISEQGETKGVLSTPVIEGIGGAGTFGDGGAVLMGLSFSPIDVGGGLMPLHGDEQVWLASYAM